MSMYGRQPTALLLSLNFGMVLNKSLVILTDRLCGIFAAAICEMYDT